ncbi:MAG: hypothetical protein JSS63_05450 [Bacteroidetes bacterium]|nr:hypothetical protein [Bacteroidota bacterium]
MEPIFTLAFSEYKTALELSKYFKKAEAYSINIPLSRFQKGYDLIIYNSETKKSITIQVKASRSYVDTAKRNHRDIDFPIDCHFLFKNFEIKLGASDYYLLFGIYVKPADNSNIATRVAKNKYSFFYLLFSESQMINFLDSIRKKNSNEPESRFSFALDFEGKIYLRRGSPETKNYSDFFLKNRIDELKKKLNPKRKILKPTKSRNKKR